MLGSEFFHLFLGCIVILTRCDLLPEAITFPESKS